MLVATKHESLERLEMQAAERGAAANTVAAYRSDLTHFLAYLEARGKGPGLADSRDIAAYQRQLAVAGMAPSTRARRLSAVRQLFKFLAAEGIIAEDPAPPPRRPKRSEALPKTLSRGRKSIASSRGAHAPRTSRGRDRLRALRLNALIEVLYATGLRVSELVEPAAVGAGWRRQGADRQGQGWARAYGAADAGRARRPGGLSQCRSQTIPA